MTDGLDTLFARTPVMAILRGYSPERTVELARRAWEVGIEGVEVPIQNARALDALAATVQAAADEGRSVGAGTVTTIARVEAARTRGAAFTVAPGLDLEVASASVAAGMPHLPGIATGTEIQQAMSAGLTTLKAFPASVLGEEWFRAMRGPFPDARFVATGGINARNARAYLDAGAVVVAVGSALEDPEQLPLLSTLTGSPPANAAHPGGPK